MPADPSAAASVTDPKLVALARAGANWRCFYCGYDARNPDGSCAQCGAARTEARQRPAAMAMRRPSSGTPWVWILGAALVLLFCGALSGLAFVTRRARPPPVSEPAEREIAARVAQASWVHRVIVERWQVVDGEGFEEQKPAEAFDVRARGERVHHVDKVPDGTTTETYTDQESYMASESYTDREQCGEDCTTRPQSCREECTNNQNGFATCRTVCSGGGQDCSPRYCDVQKTRMVSKTRPVQKTRTVTKYRDVERMAKWFSWRVWAWRVARTPQAKGAGFETRWPSESELAPDAGLGEGEKERTRPSASYEIELLAVDGTRHRVFPTTHEEFLRWKDAEAVLAVSPYAGVRLARGPLAKSADAAR